MSLPSSAVPPLRAPLTRQQKVFTMVGTLLGLFLAALDQTIVATAGPAIQRDLHIAPSLYAWITTAYLVANTMMVPIYGKLSDSVGRKPILVVGIALFLLGSFLCGVSQNSLQLILARAVQGLGSASLFTSAFAVVADLFPPAERGKYQGLFGAAFGLSSVVGPLVGGFITDSFGWHWVFFVNLPIGALALTFILTRMPALPASGHQRSLDVPGAAALVLFVVPLLVGLSMGRSQLRPGDTGFLWGSAPSIGLFLTAAAGLVLFVLIEGRAQDPILDLGLFRNRAFTMGNLATFVSGASFLGAIVFLPLFMVNVVGLSATHSGLTVTPLTLGMVAGNVLAGQLVSRLGRYKSLILIGLCVLAGAFSLMAFTLSAHSTQAEVTLKMILVGMGLGPTIPIFTVAVQNAVHPRHIGVATSTITFLRSMGATIGVALLGTVFGASLTSTMQSKVAEATRDLPPSAQALLAAPPAIPSAEGPSPTGELDVQRVKQEIVRVFAQRAEGAEAAQRTALAAAERQALAAVDRLAEGSKEAFASAIRTIYLYCLFLALAALGLTLFMPELPLRAQTPSASSSS